MRNQARTRPLVQGSGADAKRTCRICWLQILGEVRTTAHTYKVKTKECVVQFSPKSSYLTCTRLQVLERQG